MVMVLVLVSLAAWPAVAQAQSGLVTEPQQYDFGLVEPGASASSGLELWNDGSEPETLKGIGFYGDSGPFALGDEGCGVGLVLESDWGCDLEVTYAPSQSGDHTALVLVETEDGDLATARVNGSSYAPGKLVATPGALDFGVIGRAAKGSLRGVSIQNTGETPVQIGSWTLEQRAQDFQADGSACVGTLAPTETCSVWAGYGRFTTPVRVPPRPRAPTASMADVSRQIEGSLLLHHSDLTVALRVPLQGTVSEVAPFVPRSRRAVDFVRFERRLARLAGSVRWLIHRGPGRTLKLAPLRPPIAGRLSVRIRTVGNGRRVLLARSSMAMKLLESRRLSFRLTKAGRKLLRRPVRTRVKVTVAFRDRVSGVVLKGEREMKILRPAKTGKPRKAR
jgi:hypothetical protein